MRSRFDQFGKELMSSTLEPLGRVDVQLALNAETLFADARHEPVPGRDELRERLGLLGVLTSQPCLLELYSQPPSIADVRTCIFKHHLFGQQRVREVRAADDPSRGQRLRAANEHKTWILSAGVPQTVLETLDFEADARQPGLYHLRGDIERMSISLGLVVASRLPAQRSTLLIRIMCGGQPLVAAVRELAAMPPTAFERAIAEPVLLRFEHALQLDTLRDHEPYEKDFAMEMSKTWEQWRKQGQEEGRREGRQEERADTLKRLLGLKFGEIPSAHEQRIAAASLADLARYIERVLVATSIDDVFA